MGFSDGTRCDRPDLLRNSQAQIRRAAFLLLLEHARPTTAEQIAGVAGFGPRRAERLLDELHRLGRIRRNESGAIVGSAGLSVLPDRHEIDLDGRRFWTWCAYDITGIFRALGANGHARSPSPTGQTIKLQFRRGLPQQSSAVLFRPDDELLATCPNVYEDWCANSNLFTDALSAHSWAEERRLRGRIMSLLEASDLGTLEWSDVV